MEDYQFRESLRAFDFTDQLCVGYPPRRKNVSGSISIADKADMFYFLHLSPFARKTVNERGVENEPEVMEVFLNYFPTSYISSSGATKEAYIAAIAGTLPLRQGNLIALSFSLSL